MKILKPYYMNYLFWLYRITLPVLDPIRLVSGLNNYIFFIRDMVVFKRLLPSSKLLSINLYPVLNEKTVTTSVDTHYFYQQLWLFEKVLKNKPKWHIDISSTYQLSGYLSKIVRTTFMDYRPIKVKLKNLNSQKGDILNLPFKKDIAESVSCLHVIEHIGLGRYGDKLDPDGTKKACKELVRVLKPGGRLYLSSPIGKERICFNAHRVLRPDNIINYCSSLKLISFSVVDDSGKFIENCKFQKYKNADYACGMFEFIK